MRRLAGKFEWGAEGKVQAADVLDPAPQGGVDVNGEGETTQGVLTGRGSQENGTLGKHVMGLGWAQSSSFSFVFNALNLSTFRGYLFKNGLHVSKIGFPYF